MTSNPSDRFSVLAFQRFSVYLIVLAGLIVRLPMLGYSFYGDEGFTLLRDTHQLITSSEDRFRPVFFSLVYLWKQLGFHGEIGLRLLPLLFGLAQIPFAYWIGKKLDSKALGLTFATLIAASPMLIEFSQELRMYSLVALIALVQVWILLKLFEKESLALWIAFTAMAVIGVYTHLHYWLFLAGIALAFVRESGTLRLWKGFTALLAVALLYALNYSNLLLFLARRGGEYATDFPSALPKLFAAFTVGFNYFQLPEQSLGRAITWSDITLNLPLVILAAIPALIILWPIIWLHFRVERARVIMLPHELFTIPVLLAFIASLITHKYWLQPKYLIFSAPFGLLFIALAYISIRQTVLRRATALLGFLIFVIALMHFWNPQVSGRRENWRAAAETLRASLSDESTLILLPGNYGLLTYYAPELANRWQTMSPPHRPEFYGNQADSIAAKWDADAPARFESDLRTKVGDAREIFYLRYDTAQNLQDPRDLLPQALGNLAQPAGVIRFNPRLRLLRWEK